MARPKKTAEQAANPAQENPFFDLKSEEGIRGFLSDILGEDTDSGEEGFFNAIHAAGKKLSVNTSAVKKGCGGPLIADVVKLIAEKSNG